MELALHNSILAFQEIQFVPTLPNKWCIVELNIGDAYFNVKIDVCEVSTTQPESGWNLSSSVIFGVRIGLWCIVSG